MNTLLVLGFGLLGAAFALSMLVYVRRQKQKMRQSVLRFERIKKKMED